VSKQLDVEITYLQLVYFPYSHENYTATHFLPNEKKNKIAILINHQIPQIIKFRTVKKYRKLTFYEQKHLKPWTPHSSRELLTAADKPKTSTA